MKDFVPYQEALELKQLGFDEPCFARFNNDGDLLIAHTEKYIIDNGVDRSEFFTLAPLFQQAFRWFREKHNLKSCIMFRTSMEDNKEYYDWLIKGQEVVYRHFNTYEEAELACLKKLIDLTKD